MPRPGPAASRAISLAGSQASSRIRRSQEPRSALPFDRSELSHLRGEIGSRPLWLAASTHTGEEKVAARVHRDLAAHHPGLLTIIVPRHPRARRRNRASCWQSKDCALPRRAHGDPITRDTQVYLADTMGELGLFYSLAGIAFVGGSLVAKGGHNPFEAARLDCAVLHGPNIGNCAAMAAALAAAGRRNRERRCRARAVGIGAARRSAATSRARCRRCPCGGGRSRRSRCGPGAACPLARPARADAGFHTIGPLGASMMRTAPAFWARPPGLLSELLLPVGTGWEAVGRLRQAFARPYCPAVPVTCVGNLVTGGAGKTPVTLALATHLVSRGIAVHIVTRGYRGRLGGPVRVDAALHDAAAVGDEALLLAKQAPCWVARNRADGVRAAVAAGAQMVVLDDGFQNPGIAKTLSFLVVDAAYGFGNGRVIPAGPLRESPARGISRAGAVVLLGAEAAPGCLESLGISPALPALHAVLQPVAGERLAGARLLAFAGIGRPEKFFATLGALGAELVSTRSFPDHHPYRAREIDQLLVAAERSKARLITTAKDIVRVPAAKRAAIEVLEVEIRWRNPDALAEVLSSVLGA